jgi:hypothetical protein
VPSGASATWRTILARDDDDEVKVQHNQMGNIFLVGGQMAFILSHDDVDKLSGETLETLTLTHPGQAAPGHRRNPREPRQRSHGPGCRHCRGRNGGGPDPRPGLSRLRGKGVGGRLVSAIDRKPSASSSAAPN